MVHQRLRKMIFQITMKLASANPTCPLKMCPSRGDELRFKMQVERFRLFRQDIRDLVELTVQKMDLYHMVGQGGQGSHR